MKVIVLGLQSISVSGEGNPFSQQGNPHSPQVGEKLYRTESALKIEKILMIHCKEKGGMCGWG